MDLNVLKYDAATPSDKIQKGFGGINPEGGNPEKLMSTGGSCVLIRSRHIAFARTLHSHRTCGSYPT